MIISDYCILKTKTEILIELVRIHERLCYSLEEEFEYNDAICEAEELIECLGLKFELSNNKNSQQVNIITTELTNIIFELSKEIENKDLEIHYNRKYYDKE